jgi:hypothetical protein
MSKNPPTGTWVPEHLRDTRYYLFQQLWRCKVPLLAMKTSAELERFGMPTVGDREYDMSVANETQIRMLTVNQMMEAFNRGVRIQICDHTDVEKIYMHIQAHLTAWRDAIHFSYNARAPTQDLIDLDRFADVVFGKARHALVDKPIEFGVEHEISQVLRFNRENIMRAPTTVTRINEIKDEPNEDHLPVRDSLVEVFNANRSSSRR